MAETDTQTVDPVVLANGHDPDDDERPRRKGGRAFKGAVPWEQALEAAYNPDQTVAEAFYKPIEECLKYFWVPLSVNGKPCDPAVPHRLQMIEQVRQGGRWRTALREVQVDSAADLKTLSETPEYRRSRMFEATGQWHRTAIDQGRYDRALMREVASSGFDFGSDGDTTGGGALSPTRDMDDEFMPIMGGPYYRQQYLYAHWEQTARAFYEKNHSELARTAINITTDFVLGTGISWKVKNERCRRVWQEFWDRNEMPRRLRTWSDDVTWQGELLIRKDEPLRGYVRVRSLDPSAVLEIITDPEDCEQVYYYHYQAPTPYSLPYSTFKNRNINVPLQKYVIEQYPANEIHHVKINVSANEKRGRSDFYASFGTLKRHRDAVNALTLKELLQANLVWIITITGDQGDVDAFMSDPGNAQLPAFGGTWVQNTALKLEAAHQDVAGSARLGAGSSPEYLTGLFATNMQMPSTYFNSAGAGPARATALTQSEPHVKRITARQLTLQNVLDHLYEHVMRVALATGRISRDDLAHAEPEWFFPPVYEEDRGAAFRDGDHALKLRVASHRTVATGLARQLRIDSYDYDKEQLDIARDMQNPVLKSLYEKPAPMGMPGMGGPPGLSPHEDIAGADERSRFRREERDRPGPRVPGVAQDGYTGPEIGGGRR